MAKNIIKEDSNIKQEEINKEFPTFIKLKHFTRRMCHMESITGKDITKLGELQQEEIMGLADTQPESLDALENRIQDVLHRLWKAMVEWKLLMGYPRDPKSKRMEFITAFIRMLKM